MPNHYHFLIYTEGKSNNISNFMKSIQISYARYFNRRYSHSGHVFQGAYKNKPINDPIYMQKIIYYIKQNPVRDKLVNNPNDWPYSG